MNTPQFIYVSTLDEDLCSSQSEVTINSAAENILEHVFLGKYVHIFIGYIPRDGIV